MGDGRWENNLIKKRSKIVNKMQGMYSLKQVVCSGRTTATYYRPPIRYEDTPLESRECPMRRSAFNVIH